MSLKNLGEAIYLEDFHRSYTKDVSLVKDDWWRLLDGIPVVWIMAYRKKYEVWKKRGWGDDLLEVKGLSTLRSKFHEIIDLLKRNHYRYEKFIGYYNAPWTESDIRALASDLSKTDPDRLLRLEQQGLMKLSPIKVRRVSEIYELLHEKPFHYFNSECRQFQRCFTILNGIGVIKTNHDYVYWQNDEREKSFLKMFDLEENKEEK